MKRSEKSLDLRLLGAITEKLAENPQNDLIQKAKHNGKLTQIFLENNYQRSSPNFDADRYLSQIIVGDFVKLAQFKNGLLSALSQNSDTIYFSSDLLLVSLRTICDSKALNLDFINQFRNNCVLAVKHLTILSLLSDSDKATNIAELYRVSIALKILFQQNHTQTELLIILTVNVLSLIQNTAASETLIKILLKQLGTNFPFKKYLENFLYKSLKNQKELKPISRLLSFHYSCGLDHGDPSDIPRARLHFPNLVTNLYDLSKITTFHDEILVNVLPFSDSSAVTMTRVDIFVFFVYSMSLKSKIDTQSVTDHKIRETIRILNSCISPNRTEDEKIEIGVEAIEELAKISIEKFKYQPNKESQRDNETEYFLSTLRLFCVGISMFGKFYIEEYSKGENKNKRLLCALGESIFRVYFLKPLDQFKKLNI